MKTEVHYEPLAVRVGAGITLMRWAVFQDGGIRDWCQTEEDAARRVDCIVRNWESQDE